MVKTTFLKSIKKQLLKMRQDLLTHIEKDVRTESDTSRFEIGDIYDQASSERERELNLILGDRDRQKLKEIDEALRRIDEGTYGICEECGEPIEERRLRAMPFTRVCIDCKTRDEREHGKRKVYEGPEFIGRPDMTEFEEEE